MAAFPQLCGKKCRIWRRRLLASLSEHRLAKGVIRVRPLWSWLSTRKWRTPRISYTAAVILSLSSVSFGFPSSLLIYRQSTCHLDSQSWCLLAVSTELRSVCERITLLAPAAHGNIYTTQKIYKDWRRLKQRKSAGWWEQTGELVTSQTESLTWTHLRHHKRGELQRRNSKVSFVYEMPTQQCAS